MHRIGLFILMAFQAQVGMSQGPTNTSRDFGWMIDKDDGALVYIVQVAPAQATQMLNNRLENLSDIPPQLVGRATRISVRIGSDPLPRTPSLSEIEQLPRFGTATDVTAALGPGRVSELDSGGLVNVQGSAPPTLPPTLPPVGQQSRDTTGAMSGYPNLGLDQLGRGVFGGASGRLSDQNTSSAGNPPAVFPGTNFPSATTALEPGPGNPSGDRSGYADRNSTGGAGPILPRMDSFGNAQDASGRTAPNGSSNSYNNILPPALDSSGFAGLPSSRANDIRTPTPNFGSTPGSNLAQGYSSPTMNSVPQQNGGPSAGNGYGGSAYGDSAHSGGAYSGGAYSGGAYPGPQLPHVAGPLIPGQNVSAGSNDYPSERLARNARQGGSAEDDRLESSSASDRDTSSTSGSSGDSHVASAGNVLIQMFFLVSLVSNVYLVFLIRKLLTRYRSLLTTVRSQAA